MPRPSIEPESSGPFKMFGRAKKSQEEPKPELDLASALPSSDDFRTSLLMTGLSARFSMLREQDDPTSKIGKASDDSVLFPKRQSRMNPFGLSTLDDIAEVGSIRSPAFPRTGSFQSSDDASIMSGSVMNRAKPTEGNNLFGGRQKIYKINSSGTTKPGALPGRVVYDDDVAQSAFQRWRQAEKERTSLEDDQINDPYQSASLRPTSPSQDFNRRRETNSTTSSIPSVARDSTAATSVASSQPAPSLNEWQPSVTAPSSVSPNPFQERSVTRTRRLYEQGLTQELQDQQSSALSRMDTLSKNRFGNRTPEPPTNAPSPTHFAFNSERRPIMTKGSAPNLRSFSPTATRSAQPSPVESNSRFPTIEKKSGYTASPPLSPPIHEDEEPGRFIQPKDQGKATALGLFSRPAQQYNENQYTQRQRQLQQGRETPTTVSRAASIASNPTSRSRSSSSVNRAPFERSDSGLVLKPEPTVQEEVVSPTFLDMSDDEQPASLPGGDTQQTAPQVTVERPNDEEHPALRSSAQRTPSSFASRESVDPSLASNHSSFNESPKDSPTLGPGSGLSGMVRQHLRNVSNASSVYGAGPHEAELETQALQRNNATSASEHYEMETNPWESGEIQWENPYTREMSTPRSRSNVDPQQAPVPVASPLLSQEKGQEQDDFARHLADGARRVREKLTSYASDHSRSTSPVRQPAEVNQDFAPPKASAFSNMLRPRSSRGSLADRDRDTRDRSRTRANSQTRAMKMLGLGSSGNPTSPPPPKSSFDGHDIERKQDSIEFERKSSEDNELGEKDEPIHAGLKAFRQARRELQRMKEKEVLQRYQPGQAPPQAPSNPPPPPPVQHRQGPPVSFNQRIPSEESRTSRSRAGSRAGSRAPSERDRSSSETSNGGQPHGQHHGRPRLRTNSSAYDEPHHPYGPYSPVPGSNSMPHQGPSPRPYGRAPMIPPYASHRDASPGPYGRPGSANGGHMGITASTPNLASSPSAPPLPPINPRRKTGMNMGMGNGNMSNGFMRRNDDDGGYSRMPSERGPGGRSPHMMSEEEYNHSQYRQRLRKVPSESNGIGSRSRATSRADRTNPPYNPNRPPPPPTNMPGGMI